MAEFTFKSGIITLDVKNEDGSIETTYSINVNKTEQLKSWIKAIKVLDFEGKKYSEDEKAIDEIVESLKSVVTAILGLEAWEFLWEKYNHNLGGMTAFVRYIAELLNGALAKNFQSYV